MSDAKSYVAPFELNKPIQSAIVAEVTDSKNGDFKIGDFITGGLDWKQFQISSGKDLTKVDANAADLSAYLGILGMTGLTAYSGLINIANPQKAIEIGKNAQRKTVSEYNYENYVQILFSHLNRLF